jgi:hypothetical protein
MSQSAETTERGSGARLPERLSIRHLDLMGRLPRGETGIEPPEAFIAEVRSFVAEVQAAGALTSRRRDRDTLRNMLLFWAMELAKRDGASVGAPLPALADFQGEKTEAVRGGQAEPPPPGKTETLTQRGASGTESVGGSMYSGYVGPTIGMSGLGGPVASGGATAISALQTAGRQITNLVKGIAAAAGGRAAPVAAPAADNSAAKAGEAALDDSRQAIRFAALARAWKDARPEVKAGLLLSDGAIAEASAYVNDDPDIKAFVQASREWQSKRDRFRRRTRYALFGLSGAIIAFAVGALVILHLYNQLWFFSQSLEAIKQDRRRISDDARTAVDALGDGNIAPLKTLLQRIARAEPSELEPLQVRVSSGITSATAASNNVAVTQRRAPSNAVQDVVRQAPACSGALWLGSAAEGGSRLQNIADPSTVQVGDRITTLAGSDIRLRAGLPVGDYVMTSQIGLVPGGSAVTVADKPEPYPRRGIDQFWAKVTVPRQFCTSVFVQYTGLATRLPEVESALKNLGVQVPQSEVVETVSARAEVRYFWVEDAAVASAVARQLAPFNGDKVLELRALTNFPNRPASGRVEVWISLP